MSRLKVLAILIGLVSAVFVYFSLQRPAGIGESQGSDSDVQGRFPPVQEAGEGPESMAFSDLHGAEAPPFRLKTITGEIVSVDSLKGKPAILMFWASWCEVCKRELPNLKALYDRQKSKLQFLAIGFADEEQNIRGYVQGHGGIFAFPVAYDEGDMASDSFRVKGTPTFYLLNGKGQVVASHLGAGFLSDRAFQDFILSL